MAPSIQRHHHRPSGTGTGIVCLLSLLLLPCLVPAVVLETDSRGPQFSDSPLRARFKLFDGDNVEDTVQAFCASYNIRLRSCSALLAKTDELLASRPPRPAAATPRPLDPNTIAPDFADVGPLVDIEVTVVAGEGGVTPGMNILGLPMASSSLVALLLHEMHERPVIDNNGSFIFPPYVERVWIDACSHHCETTADKLLEDPTLGVIAIEANPRAWRLYPRKQQPRLITLPFALDEREMPHVFHVTSYDHASSLGQPAEHVDGFDVAQKLLVQTVRLERILASVPEHISIDWLKTDCQGADLRVIRSAGPQLARIKLIQAEVLFTNMYEMKQPVGRFADFMDFLKPRGFSLSSVSHLSDDINDMFDPFEPPEGLTQCDAQFLNLALTEKKVLAQLRVMAADWYYDKGIFDHYDDKSVVYEPTQDDAPVPERYSKKKIVYGFAPRP